MPVHELFYKDKLLPPVLQENIHMMRGGMEMMSGHVQGTQQNDAYFRIVVLLIQ